MAAPEADEPRGTMRRDVASAYFLAASRIASWVIVSAIVYRWIGARAFAALAFVRATIGLLNYASLGYAPALVRMLAEARAHPVHVLPAKAEASDQLIYSGPQPVHPIRAVYAAGIAAARLTHLLGCLFLLIYLLGFELAGNSQLAGQQVTVLSLCLGLAAVLRLGSEAPGAMLQTSGRIDTDNYLQAIGEWGWLGLIAFWQLLILQDRRALAAHWPIIIGSSYLGSFFLMTRLRWVEAEAASGHARRAVRWRQPEVRWKTLRRLFGFGLLVSFAQLADYLYAPTDYVLIAWLLDASRVADYAPAVQIDSGLLLLVTGISAVLLPKAALADAAGDAARVRRYYIKGTLLSTGVLAAAAIAVWGAAPWILRLWLGDSMPRTRAILPLVLIHTVIGGSSGVGRAILLGMGKMRAFAISVLAAGVVNVVLSYCFVKYGGWGLNGIVLGTIIAVVGRCALWMPWYVMRQLRPGRAGTVQSASRVAWS